MAQPDASLVPQARPIRTTMGNGVQHPFKVVAVDRLTITQVNPYDCAHWVSISIGGSTA
jgi:hypothetical protein